MTGFSLHLFGSFDARLDGVPVTQFRSDKVRALLAYLAVEAGYPHRREVLASLLWPEWPDRQARRNLTNSLSRLRSSLGQTLSRRLLTVTRSAVQLNATHLWLDVNVFQHLIMACETHTHEAFYTCDRCIARLTQAVELYRGEFMAGFTLSDAVEYEGWLLMQRENHHNQQLTLLYNLAAAHDGRGNYEAAQTYARQQIQLEPWRELAHRQLMRSYALSGQRSAALIQYEVCRQILKDKLGVEPSAKTQALYEKIRNNGMERREDEVIREQGSPFPVLHPYKRAGDSPMPLHTPPRPTAQSTGYFDGD